jgi:hypothetical protein
VLSVKRVVPFVSALIAVAGFGVALPSTSGALACGPTFSHVTSPNVGSADNEFYGLSSASSANAWAVGIHVGTVGRTLTEHWDGRSWKVVKSPNVGAGNN